MIRTTTNIYSIFISLFFAALICNTAIADEHHHDHHHGGGADFGIYFGPDPFYYPYNPYYYPAPGYVIYTPAPARQPSVDRSAAGLLIMKAQVQLTSLGYYQGSIDGVSGPQTKAAVKAFQHNKGLAETGELDDATLKALGVSKT